jgi:hypothetical protein
LRRDSRTPPQPTITLNTRKFFDDFAWSVNYLECEFPDKYDKIP